MSEIIRCPHCGSYNLCHDGAGENSYNIGLTYFKCNDCRMNFWYNTGNAKTVINIKN